MNKERKKNIVGMLTILSNGSGIVSIENIFMEDVLISKKDLNGAFNNDQVEIQINYNVSGIRTAGKVLKVKKWIKDNNHSNYDEIYFYTDSHNDIKLMEFCTKPIAVDPDSILKDLSIKNNWKIISLR